MKMELEVGDSIININDKKIYKIFSIKKVGYVVNNHEGETFYFHKNAIRPTFETLGKAIHITPQATKGN